MPDITDPGPLWRRLAWFAGIAAASAAVVALVAEALRFLILH